MNRCPCITRARGNTRAFWSFSHHRFLHVDELMRLQGFAKGRIQPTEDTTDAMLGAMVGNSQDVHLLSKLVKEVLVLIV